MRFPNTQAYYKAPREKKLQIIPGARGIESYDFYWLKTFGQCQSNLDMRIIVTQAFSEKPIHLVNVLGDDYSWQGLILKSTNVIVNRL